MSNNITVSYISPSNNKSTGQIKITNPNGPTKYIDTDNFYEIDISKIKDSKYDESICNKNENDQNFIIDQQHLRALDMMKDAYIKTPVSDKVYGISYSNLDSSFLYNRSSIPFKELLHNMENKFLNCKKDYIRRPKPWTKITKDSSLDPKLPQKYIFKAVSYTHLTLPTKRIV